VFDTRLAAGNPHLIGSVTAAQILAEIVVHPALRSSITTKVEKYRLKRSGTDWKIVEMPQ